jgi:putative ABC transport system permease protein
MNSETRKEHLTDGPPRRSDREVWRENFFQALDVIRTHKMRSGLLILGVAIGVTTVLAIVTVMTGLSRRIKEDFISADRPYLMVTRYDPMGDEDRSEIYRRKKLTAADVRAIEETCQTVDRVDYEIDSGRMRVLRHEGERTSLIQVAGVSHNFGYMFSLEIEEGRNFTELEQERRKRVAVLGHGPAKDLFPNKDPIGARIKIGNHEYEVVGTIKAREHIIGSIGDNFVAVPYPAFEKDFSGGKWDDHTIVVTVKPEYTLEETSEEVTALLRARRKVPPGARNDFYVTTSESFKDLLGKITGGISLVLVVISSIGLMVGGIGVMNIMLISVTERTREVGIRMAMGAKRRDILQQFLIEASTLTGAGGIVGIGFGLLAAKGIATLIRFPYGVPLIWIFIAFVFSASIGLIFGMYPANRAARMDPITALHYE